MKKMICEICGSQQIKKENGIFVCQECGTGYSLEEAKNLLQEVGDAPNNNPAPVQSNSSPITSENDKYKLLKNLSVWAKFLEIVESFKELKFSTTDESFWALDHEGIMELPSIFPSDALTLSINANPAYNHCTPLEKEFARQNEYKILLTENEIPFNVRRMYETLKNDFTVKSTSTVLGITYFAGDSYVKAFKSNYTADNGGTRICESASSSDLSSWLIELEYQCCLDGAQCQVFKKRLFGGPSLLYDFKPLARELRDAKTNKGKVYEREYQEVILPELNKRKEEFWEVLAEAKEIEEVFNLPISYRKFSIVVNIMRLIMMGKAETWKEAVLLYDEELFRNNLMERFDQIQDAFGQLNKTIENGIATIGYQLSDIDLSLSSLNTKLCESNARLSKIQTYSFITMWNTL